MALTINATSSIFKSNWSNPLTIASQSSKTITAFFEEVINTSIAIATEIYAMTLYFPVIYLKGRVEPFNHYGLNPAKVSKEQADLPAVLFLHGDMHNQSGALPLAYKIEKFIAEAKQKGQASPIGAVFSLTLNYDDLHPEVHQKQLSEKITYIKNLYQEQGEKLQLIFVGHSKGAIEAADYTYCRHVNNPQDNVTVQKVISLAGRLQNIPSKWRPCPKEIENQVQSISKAILNHPEIPLYNIVAGKDWILPPEAAFINKSKTHSLFIPNRSHLGILCSSQAIDQAIEWIKRY